MRIARTRRYTRGVFAAAALILLVGETAAMAQGPVRKPPPTGPFNPPPPVPGGGGPVRKPPPTGPFNPPPGPGRFGPFPSTPPAGVFTTAVNRGIPPATPQGPSALGLALEARLAMAQALAPSLQREALFQSLLANAAARSMQPSVAVSPPYQPMTPPMPYYPPYMSSYDMNSGDRRLMSGGASGYGSGTVQLRGEPSQVEEAQQPAQPLSKVDQLLQQMDNDKDGRISRTEARGLVLELFNQLDRDGNGHLDREELQAAVDQYAGLRR